MNKPVSPAQPKPFTPFVWATDDSPAWRAVVEWAALQESPVDCIHELASAYIYYREECKSLRSLYEYVENENLDLRLKIRQLEASHE